MGIIIFHSCNARKIFCLVLCDLLFFCLWARLSPVKAKIEVFLFPTESPNKYCTLQANWGIVILGQFIFILDTA